MPRAGDGCQTHQHHQALPQMMMMMVLQRKMSLPNQRRQRRLRLRPRWLLQLLNQCLLTREVLLCQLAQLKLQKQKC